jgi:Tol biopolymer transport system component
MTAITRLLALLLLASAAAAQNTAVPFAEGVVSTGHEFGLTFSRGSKEAYFSRREEGSKFTHVFRSEFRDGKWQSAEPVGFSGDPWQDLDPFVSPDGKRIFFISTRPAPGTTADAKPNMDIWYADRKAAGWGEPKHVANVSSEFKEGTPVVTRDGTMYFFSDREAPGKINNIYVSKLVKSEYQPPLKLSSEINSGLSDTSPFISPDGKTLLFYSQRDGGEGKADLYVSFLQKGAWEKPVNLGKQVNTAAFEYNPVTSRDGRTLFFGRDRRLQQIDLSALGIKELKPQLFTR